MVHVNYISHRGTKKREIGYNVSIILIAAHMILFSALCPSTVATR